MDNNQPEETYMIITMNAGGYPGYTNMRKTVLKHIVNMYNPTIVLLQELSSPRQWLVEVDRVFPRNPAIPTIYNIDPSTSPHVPHILVDRHKVNMTENNNLFQEVGIPENITAEQLISLRTRMCLQSVSQNGGHTIIVISWHGIHRMNEAEKLGEFRRLMLLVQRIRNRYGIPILLGGDFNINIDVVRNLIPNPFVLYQYRASERRVNAGVIDFFIATSDLHLFDVHFMATDGVYTIDEVQYAMMSPFDHDPIQARLEFVTANQNVIEHNIHSEDICPTCIYRRLHPNGLCPVSERCVQCEIIRLGVMDVMLLNA